MVVLLVEVVIELVVNVVVVGKGEIIGGGNRAKVLIREIRERVGELN